MDENKGKVGAPRRCVHCGKVITKALYLIKNGKRLSASFCSEAHYMEFWANTPGFAPLPLWNDKNGCNKCKN